MAINWLWDNDRVRCVRKDTIREFEILNEPTLKQYRIYVTVDNGTSIIIGQVETKEEARNIVSNIIIHQFEEEVL